MRIFVNIMQIRVRNEEGMARVRSRDVRSIALKTLGKERDCSQSIATKNGWRSVSSKLQGNLILIDKKANKQTNTNFNVCFVLFGSTGQ